MKFFNGLAATALIVAAGCGGSGTDSVTGTTTGGTTGGTQTGGTSTTNAISVNDNFFSPNSTQVPVGATVTWTWVGSSTHNVTFTDASSGDKTTGQSFSRTFSSAGTFNYRCTLHGGMTGAVIVQ